MTDRERQMIEAYLPNPRDPELDEFDYYVLDMADRVQRVHIVNVAPDKYNEEMVQVYTDAGKLVHGCYETDTELWGGGWYHRGALYDNKQDCRYSVHSMCNNWEYLRELQRKEAEA